MIQNIGNKQNASKYLPDKLSVGAISRFSIPEALELMKEQTGLKREQIKLNKMNEINNNNETANDAKPVLAVVPTCNHFWKMVTKDYYKCSWCDLKHYR